MAAKFWQQRAAIISQRGGQRKPGSNISAVERKIMKIGENNIMKRRK
jgi:hypothetical protein